MKEIKRIGLGTFPFAGVFGQMEEKNVAEIIDQFFSYGGRLIHVAPVYAMGKVEEIVGNILKRYERNKYTLMTCCGWVIENGNSRRSAKYDEVVNCCENSLSVLNTDYIDIYMLHLPDLQTPAQETADALSKLLEQGKIKEICVSNVDLEQLKAYNKYGNISYIQNRMSLINQSIDTEFRTYCKDNNIKLMAYQSIERGLLTSRVLGNFGFAENDLRLKKPEFAENTIKEIASFVKATLLPIAESLSIPISSLALKWLLDTQYADISLCGISKNRYFDDVLAVDNTPSLSPEVIETINEGYKIFSDKIESIYNISVRTLIGTA
ncbi:MAG: aldo/keto reductase [Spirochaetaceae bacterium]|jgi:aryl-alcohol dehydrogenase-like predicted oxidoreductase|nr:aldo/keto reductase [Spirochaetaceae bacterium]